MGKQRDKYSIGKTDLSSIRNRNEARVLACLRQALDDLGNPELSDKMLKDAYAFALNQLPARYTQGGTIVLRDPVRKEQLHTSVAEALRKVLNNPKDI